MIVIDRVVAFVVLVANKWYVVNKIIIGSMFCVDIYIGENSPRLFFIAPSHSDDAATHNIVNNYS